MRRARRPQKFRPATSWPDYLLDEAGYPESNEYERDGIYWREQLEPRPDAATLSGKMPAKPGEVIVSIGLVAPAVVTRLERVGAASNATLAASRPRGDGGPTIPARGPAGHRPWPADDRAQSPALRRVYGFLSNMVPLRLHVDPYASFAALVKQTGALLLAARRHQRYPGHALRQDLALLADAPNIYGTVVNILQQDAGTNFRTQRGTLHLFPQASRVEDVALTIHMGEASGLRVQFDANRARYDAASLEQIQRSFIALLESVADDASGPTAMIPGWTPGSGSACCAWLRRGTLRRHPLGVFTSYSRAKPPARPTPSH